MRIKLISGWGNNPKILSKVFAPKTIEEAQNIIDENLEICPLGNGRAYGDAGLNHQSISSKNLKNIISFDEKEGFIECESGVLLDEILKTSIPKGWFLGVTPGTKYVSIGGAIGSDIHGKNHHFAGCFSEFVETFSILTESGLRICSLDENRELFNSTFGAMGQTGFIVSARIKLIPIQSSNITGNQIQVKNLSEMMDVFEKHSSTTYSVAWIDCLAKKEKLGRGVVSFGEHSTDGTLEYIAKKGPIIPGFFPGFMLNKISIGLFNKLYFAKGKSKSFTQSYEPFFYPLDGLQQWNNIYGGNGFIQYQFVLPLKTSRTGLNEIINFVAQYKTPPFLTVLKLFGKGNPSKPHSFPIEGYTLAMDFKWHEGIHQLVQKLDELVIKYEGRVYLAKDRLSDSAVIPNRPHLNSKFKSLQSKRLDLSDQLK